MADVVAIETFRRERGGDDARFLGCPCGTEFGFGVVVRFASGKAFVAALLCLGCETESSVANGFVE
jgi:hypothetical protein